MYCLQQHRHQDSGRPSHLDFVVLLEEEELILAMIILHEIIFNKVFSDNVCCLLLLLTSLAIFNGRFQGNLQTISS